MENRIVILGSNGQLGTALTKLCDKKSIEYLALDYPQIDLTRSDSYYEIISKFKPDTLINCAAYTDVYKAEKNIMKATEVNGSSLKYLVDLCNQYGIYLMHISTDYVFSGNKGEPYNEDDKPDPVNIYGITKYFGEKIVQLYSKNYSIIRTAALYGESQLNSINIVKKIIKLASENDEIKLVKNEITSPTYAYNLAEQIMVILEKKLQGIIHASSQGQCNWVEFADYLYKQLEIDVKIEEVESGFFGKVRKPLYSCLSNGFLDKQNINLMRNWKENLKIYLKSNEII